MRPCIRNFLLSFEFVHINRPLLEIRRHLLWMDGRNRFGIVKLRRPPHAELFARGLKSVSYVSLYCHSLWTASRAFSHWFAVDRTNVSKNGCLIPFTRAKVLDRVSIGRSVCNLQVRESHYKNVVISIKSFNPLWKHSIEPFIPLIFLLIGGKICCLMCLPHWTKGL